MNCRRVVVEDRVLSLADALEAEAPLLAARLRETVPAGFGNVGEHVPVMRSALVDTARRTPSVAPEVDRVLGALDDLPAVLGRRGHVWIGHDSDEEGRTSGYQAYWADGDGSPATSPDPDADEVPVDDWLETSPADLDPDAVVAWARARSDDIRCSLEPGDEVAVVVGG